jgi:hypothetical protein
LRQITGNRRKRDYRHRRDEKYAYLEANRSRYRQAKYPGTLNILQILRCVKLPAQICHSLAGHITPGVPLAPSAASITLLEG